tara:strand:- start:865 stop:1059 length:195 start_codon:yes stop_codon:yes gene_type:complete
MIYTAVFQNSDCAFIFETHVSSHDRTVAWHDIHEKREDENSCLVLLIDGQANVRTFEDIVDIPW